MQNHEVEVDVKAASGRPLWARLEMGVLGLMILLHLAPVWAFRYLPTQDGPAHVENAMILRRYFSASGGLYQKYYMLNHHPAPNLLGHVLLAGLMFLVNPLTAEKIVVSLFVIGLPPVVRYAARSMRAEGGWAALLVFPFIFGLPLHKGVYNFCLGLVIFFWMVGFYLRHRKWSAGAVAGLMGLALLGYFAHVVPLIMGMLTVGLLALGEALARPEEGREARRTRGGEVLRGLGLPAAAFAPAAAMVLLFFAREGTAAANRIASSTLLKKLVMLSALDAYGGYDRILAVATAIVIGAGAIVAMSLKIGRRDRDRHDLLLVITALSLGLYLLVPNSAGGGGQISFRLSLFPWFGLILWLGAQRLGAVVRAGMLAAAIAVAIGFVGVTMAVFGRLNVYMEDLMSVAPRMARGSTFLPVFPASHDYDRRGRGLSLVVHPFVHAGGRIAVGRSAVDLSNYEARTDFFPLQFRPELDPGGLLDGQAPDLLGYSARTEAKGSIDYVIVWDTRPRSRRGAGQGDSEQAKLLQQLQEGYERIYGSPRGFATLYRRR